MTIGAEVATAVEVYVVEDKVALVLESANCPPIIAVLSSSDAHKLRGRLHKAANDAGAAQARKTAA